MKKIKALFFAMLLSTCLVGNVFAGGTLATITGTGFFSFFSDAVNAVASFFRSSEDCPPRQCTMCRPGGGNENDPNCRPLTN